MLTRKIKLFVVVVTLHFTLYTLHCLYASTRGLVNKGNSAYNSEKYDAALENYQRAQDKKPNSCEIPFNFGNVYYKTGNYEEAMKSYEKATYSKDIELQEKSYYNMGNSLFRLGKLPEAIQFYKKALEMEPNDNDAKFNLEFAQKKIKENQDKQKKENEKKDKDKDKKENKDKDKNKEQEKEKEKGEDKQQKMSKEDANRILNSLPDEKKPKEKANMKVPLFTMPEKDW